MYNAVENFCFPIFRVRTRDYTHNRMYYGHQQPCKKKIETNSGNKDYITYIYDGRLAALQSHTQPPIYAQPNVSSQFWSRSLRRLPLPLTTAYTTIIMYNFCYIRGYIIEFFCVPFIRIHAIRVDPLFNKISSNYIV